MSYKVRLDIFEGPFDLLVYLIERSGLSIYDVNISEITQQYIDYVDEIQKVDPEAAAEFMVLAATLIQIKSKMLLPSAKKAGAQRKEDPRDELAQKLAEYRKMKYLSEKLREKETLGARIYTKPREDISRYTNSPLEKFDIDTDRFFDSFKAFLEKRRSLEEVKNRYQRVDRERMTMERKSLSMRDRIKNAERLDFTELIDDVNDRYDVVLTFVTMLEMLKAGIIFVEQDEVFGNIEVVKNDRYHGSRFGAEAAAV